MRYMLLIQMNPAVFSSLSTDEQDAIYRGHEEFQALTKASGEFVSTSALADPADSVTVRVRAGATTASPSLANAAAEFMCGYYIVECTSKERAIALAALVPDARYTAMEVREFIA